MTAATEIPADVMSAAREALAAWHNPADAPITLEYALACAILAERQRAADWCDKTAFLELEQGELRAQRALENARRCILSGDDV